MLYLVAVFLEHVTTSCALKWGISSYCNELNILMLTNVKKNCDETLIL